MQNEMNLRNRHEVTCWAFGDEAELRVAGWGQQLTRDELGGTVLDLKDVVSAW